MRFPCAFPALSMRFPCAFPALSLRFPMRPPALSLRPPAFFLRFPCAFPAFPCVFPAFSLRFPMRFPCAVHALSLRFPALPLRYPCALPALSLRFPRAIPALSMRFPCLSLRLERVSVLGAFYVGRFFTSLSELCPLVSPYRFRAGGCTRVFLRRLNVCGDEGNSPCEVRDVAHFPVEVEWELSLYLNYDPKDYLPVY